MKNILKHMATDRACRRIVSHAISVVTLLLVIVMILFMRDLTNKVDDLQEILEVEMETTF